MTTIDKITFGLAILAAAAAGAMLGIKLAILVG